MRKSHEKPIYISFVAPVDQFAEETETWHPVSGLDVKQVLNVLGRLNLPEDGKVLDHELRRHLNRVQLQEGHGRLLGQVGHAVVGEERLGALHVLYVVPEEVEDGSVENYFYYDLAVTAR